MAPHSSTSTITIYKYPRTYGKVFLWHYCCHVLTDLYARIPVFLHFTAVICRTTVITDVVFSFTGGIARLLFDGMLNFLYRFPI